MLSLALVRVATPRLGGLSVRRSTNGVAIGAHSGGASQAVDVQTESGCGARGIEHPPTSAPSVVDRRGNDADQATQDDERRSEVSASGDVVEVALAKAIEAEVQERRPGWEALAVLAGELQARRLARRVERLENAPS
jgi:hypothetical protein